METGNDDSKSKMEDYAILELIGRGALGTTFLVQNKIENKKYVLKKIRLSKQTEKFKIKAFQEMDLIAKLRHPYILEYKDAWVDKGSCICTVSDYCEVGNISDVIRKARGAFFSEEKICKWLTQLLLAINYLHSNRVLHRDLKLSNIFVTKENDILLGDFGLSKLLNEDGIASSVAGTPNYICPELVANTPYGYKSDIWSLGCLMFEIAAHQQAFKAPDMNGLINKINRSLISPMPIVYSSTLKQIFKSMLRKSPEHRPTAAELLRHPHLQPFLLRCHNPSTVFLPVKSPSPNSGKDKTKSPSPSSPSSRKDHGERKTKLKKRELLPLFDESTNMQYPSLLDGDALVEDLLETKRVDPTSYSGKISHDSEDSKSGGTCETTACNGDDHDNCESSPLQDAVCEEQESEKTKLVQEPLCVPDFTEETRMKMEGTILDTVCSDSVASCPSEIMPLVDIVSSEADQEPRNSSSCLQIEEDITSKSRQAEKEAISDMLLNAQAAIIGDGSKGNLDNPGQRRAEALESLLELCARLLKQDKFDELAGVLTAFGEESVSSRETAIWLTKSLMNAQKLAKDS